MRCIYINNLIKAEGVKDCVKWIEKRIKEKQRQLNECSSYYDSEIRVLLQTEINEAIEIKISLEKYAKKLKHMTEEFL